MMKNLTIAFLFFLLIFASGCGVNSQAVKDEAGNKSQTAVVAKSQSQDLLTSSADKVADRLEVYYFYRTQRCVSCLTMGEYVNKTIFEYFSEQIENGQIDYREINIDLPENKDLARKFQASGSSLYINSIQGEQESIENVMEIWRLKGNETQFKNFLKRKLNTLLGL